MKPGPPASVVTDALVDYCVERMVYCVRKYVLKREVSLILYGEGENEDGSPSGQPKKLIEISAYERLRSRARQVLAERVAISTEKSKQESIGFYENMLLDPDVQPRTKIKARENLDKITKVADHNAPGFIPIVGQMTHRIVDVDKLGLTLEQKKKMLEDIRDNDS